MEPGEAGGGHGLGQLDASDLLVHGRRQQPDVGEVIECGLDLGNEGDALTVEGRLVEIGFSSVRGEVLFCQLLTGGQHRVEGFAGVSGESFALTELVDAQPIVEEELDAC